MTSALGLGLYVRMTARGIGKISMRKPASALIVGSLCTSASTSASSAK